MTEQEKNDNYNRMERLTSLLYASFNTILRNTNTDKTEYLTAACRTAKFFSMNMSNADGMEAGMATVIAEAVKTAAETGIYHENMLKKLYFGSKERYPAVFDHTKRSISAYCMFLKLMVSEKPEAHGILDSIINDWMSWKRIASILETYERYGTFIKPMADKAYSDEQADVMCRSVMCIKRCMERGFDPTSLLQKHMSLSLMYSVISITDDMVRTGKDPIKTLSFLTEKSITGYNDGRVVEIIVQLNSERPVSMGWENLIPGNTPVPIAQNIKYRILTDKTCSDENKVCMASAQTFVKWNGFTTALAFYYEQKRFCTDFNDTYAAWQKDMQNTSLSGDDLVRYFIMYNK